MKKLLLFIVFFLILVFSFRKETSAFVMYQSSYAIGDEVTIQGTGFGSYNDYSYLCFNNEEDCLDYNSEEILSWTDNSITFTLPRIADNGLNRGRLTVYKGDIKLQSRVEVDSGSFNIHPSIYHVYHGDPSDEFEVSSITSYEKITLIGEGFGDEEGYVYFGPRAATIESWNDRQIRLKVPEILNDLSSFTVKHHNEEFEYPFPAYTDITDDPYSGYQRYLISLEYHDFIKTLNQLTNVTVAIIDTGVYINHPDLRDNIWVNNSETIGNDQDDDNNGYIDDIYGYDFLNDSPEMTTVGGHGTAVAGIIGADRNNSIGIAGLSSFVKLMSLIACSEEDGCPTDAVVEAIYYATDNGASIINLSLSSYMTTGYSDDFNEAIAYAYDRGVLIIASSGNGDVEGKIGQSLSLIPQSPVCNDNEKNMVLGVGSSTPDNKYISKWSNYGECVDIYAPGEKILTTTVPAYSMYEGFFGYGTGTSFAAPIVSGIAAIILSAHPHLTNVEVQNYITENTINGVVNPKKIFRKIKEDHGKSYKNSKSPILTSDDEGGLEEQFNPFDDFDNDFKNYTAIIALYKKNIINGYDDGSFKPNNTINRAEILKIIVESRGVEPIVEKYNNCFEDVKDEWFAPYVCYAKEQGWIEGYTDGTFKPAQVVNKVESLKMLLEIYNVSFDETNVNNTSFLDINTSAWYWKYVSKAYSLGIIEETGSFLIPDAGMTRGSFCESLHRLTK